MNSNRQIDLSQLLQDIFKAVLISCFVHKEISQKNYQIEFKNSQFDPVTQADYFVQQIITNFIGLKYPNIKMIGQENSQTQKDAIHKFKERAEVMDYHKIDPNGLVQKFPLKKNSVFINLSEICLWIDPLDCTRGFISNKKQEVTILVGVTQNHRPIAGVIGQPFKLDSSNKCIFNPSVFIGSELFIEKKNQCYEYLYFQKFWKKWEKFDRVENGQIERKVAISSRRSGLKQQSLIKSVKMERYEIGGSGSKFVKLITKEVGVLMFIDARTAKWDSCAGEAIIKSLGGFSIKPDLSEIDYDPNSQYGNDEGFIVSLSSSIFEQILKHISTPEFQNCSSQRNDKIEPKAIEPKQENNKF